VVSATDPHILIIGFIVRNRYFFFQVVPHEAEWIPFQTHCFSENPVAPGMKPGISGSVAKNSDHQTTEAVP
jgi:hypothetical protein